MSEQSDGEDLEALTRQQLVERLRAESEARASAEEALQQARELQEARTLAAVRRLADGVAHDFNNLLTLIGLHAESLQSERRESGDKAGLSDVEGALHRSARVTRALLSFAAPVAGHRDVFDLRGLLEDVEKFIRSTFPENLSVEFDVARELWMRGDPAQIRQALTLVLDNARDALSDGGRLRVAADVERGVSDAHDSFVHVVVRDWGKGMSSETLRRAFEPFFTTKPDSKSSGLGLSIVHGLVASHRGDVVLRSEIGGGTTVRMRFPFVSRPSQLPPEAKPAGHLRILLADDDPHVRAALAASFRRHGHEVRQVGDAEALIEVVRDASDLDVLVVDVELPGRSGVEAVQELRVSGVQVPVVLITGHAEIPGGVPDLSRVEVLRKPFGIPTLEAAVVRLGREETS